MSTFVLCCSCLANKIKCWVDQSVIATILYNTYPQLNGAKNKHLFLISWSLLWIGGAGAFPRSLILGPWASWDVFFPWQWQRSKSANPNIPLAEVNHTVEPKVKSQVLSPFRGVKIIKVEARHWGGENVTSSSVYPVVAVTSAPILSWYVKTLGIQQMETLSF